jgi:hypothetical protein
MYIADTPESIAFFHLCAQISALRLEILGLRHSRGSVYAHVKRQYGLTGNKASVLAQLVAKKEATLAARSAE